MITHYCSGDEEVKTINITAVVKVVLGEKMSGGSVEADLHSREAVEIGAEEAEAGVIAPILVKIEAGAEAQKR